MPLLVMKFGGTSVADLDRIRNVAAHVKREVDAGHQVAVVVSAMAGKTNELVALCRGASALHDAREYDAVVASGEQVTSGLLAIALQHIAGRLQWLDRHLADRDYLVGDRFTMTAFKHRKTSVSIMHLLSYIRHKLAFDTV